MATATATAAKRLQLDGVDLEYFEAGRGPTLLVLHGFLEMPGWNDFHDRLAQRFHVVAPSHPGFGGSSRPEWMTSLDDLANFYLDLIDRLGAGKTHVVGHSFGGWVAAEMAVRCSHGLGKLVLADAVGLPAPGGPVRPAGGSIADWLVLEPEDLRALAWHDPATGDRLKLAGEDVTSEEELIAILKNREAATLYGWKPFFHSPRLAHWLHRASVPALVIWGEHDGVVPRAIGEAYAHGIGGARLEIVPGAAHLPHLEQPDEFARLVADFLAE
ncbi:MAG TPA: alpha/beta hydrolase [Chloroflexota bacterium]|nr:alpha/beta hydrolase [Chloroflexota bacterium]